MSHYVNYTIFPLSSHCRELYNASEGSNKKIMMSPQTYKRFKRTTKDMLKLSQEFKRDIIEGTVETGSPEPHSVVQQMAQFAAKDIKEQIKSRSQMDIAADEQKEEKIVEAGLEAIPILLCMPTLQTQVMLLTVDSRGAQEFLAWSSLRKVDVVHLPGFSSVTQSSISPEAIGLNASDTQAPTGEGGEPRATENVGQLMAIEADDYSNPSQSTHPCSSTSPSRMTSTDMDSVPDTTTSTSIPRFGLKRRASQLSITDESVLLRDSTADELSNPSGPKSAAPEKLNYSMDTQAGQSPVHDQAQALEDIDPTVLDDSQSSVEPAHHAIATSSPAARLASTTSVSTEQPATTGEGDADVTPAMTSSQPTRAETSQALTE